jgi:hypothetical protein
MTVPIPPEALARLREQTARRRLAEKATRLRAAALACSRRGPATGETFECKACGQGTRRVPLYACDLHGACSLRDVREATACCRVCPDRDGLTARGGG